MKAGRNVRPGLCLALLALSVGAWGKPPAPPWWQDEINVMSWAQLHQPEDRPYLDYARQLGSGVADRGLFFGHYGAGPVAGDAPGMREAAAFYQSHALKVTAFLSVEGWDPAPESAAKLTAVLKSYVDVGCDGVHLDMLFQPAAERNATDAVRRMRDELHRYGQAKYGRDVMFTGNVWRLDSPFNLQVGALTDVVWIESWGNSDRELVRMARVARSLGRFRIPVWYHFQPDTDTQNRVQRLVDLPKALFSSCLFEDARFLCNYKYPVPVRRTAVGTEQGAIDWKTFFINPGWRQSVVQYATFARAYRSYLTGGLPQAPVLVAFRPDEVQQANSIMDELLAHRIDFNVLVYGNAPLRPAITEDLRGYARIVTPGPHPELQPLAKHATFVTQAQEVVDAGPATNARLLKIAGAPEVVGRVFLQGNRRIVHLKQMGYRDEKDSLGPTGALTLTVYAPGVRGGFYASPEKPGKTALVLHRTGDYVTFTTPGIPYFALAVLE